MENERDLATKKKLVDSFSVEAWLTNKNRTELAREILDNEDLPVLVKQAALVFQAGALIKADREAVRRLKK